MFAFVLRPSVAGNRRWISVGFLAFILYFLTITWGQSVTILLAAQVLRERPHSDLVEESGFSDSYQSVKRFVRKLRSIQPERVWRLECQPGEELQLDFGLGAPIDDAQGKTRRSWVLRMVLSYSRKGSDLTSFTSLA